MRNRLAADSLREGRRIPLHRDVQVRALGCVQQQVAHGTPDEEGAKAGGRDTDPGDPGQALDPRSERGWVDAFYVVCHGRSEGRCLP